MDPFNSSDTSIIKLDLPDPENNDISGSEFLDRLEKAWSVCERVDLQTEIWRGKILRTIRDREKRGGDGRGTGFLQWLREMEISKSRAYQLIQLADSSENLVDHGILQEGSVNNFSRRAFIETAQSLPEVQQMISEAANEGQEISRKQVKRLSDEFTSVTSPLLPEEIREKTQSNLLPPKIVAPLVKELSKLPPSHQEEMRESLKSQPEVENIKDITETAKWMAKSIDASFSLKTFQSSNIDLEKALQEAKRLDTLGVLSDALGQAKTIENSVIKLYLAWKRLTNLYDKLWVESGSSTPYLREVLQSLNTITGSNIKVSLGEISGGKKIRLQIVEENLEQIDPNYLN